jgi:tetratricopeptide (TPR) repeat protein
MPALVREAYPPHLLAQKLNNRGALCIETGRYERAIATLTKALRLCKRVASDETCRCRFCGLDECMSMNQSVPPHRSLTRQDAGSSFYGDCDSSRRMPRRSQEETSSSEDFECRGGYIYRNPIHVSPHSMQEGHSMGATLSLIVIFNLALAHHLAAVQNSMCQRRLQKALQLYKLAYQLYQLYQLEEQPMQEVNLLHFTMIFANNLGEVHRTVNNRSEHMMFLQHLLSTIMYLVDCHIPAESIELDGFFRNTSQLILQKRCASAA